MALSVVLKSDPSSAVKGRFQCQITGHGLALSQGKNQFTIPIGANARHAGKNRIDVMLPQCRLEIVVAKFGSYTAAAILCAAVVLAVGFSATSQRAAPAAFDRSAIAY